MHARHGGSWPAQAHPSRELSPPCTRVCEQVVVENLKDPMQLTVPLADRADAKTKCTGQPDARSQLKGLLNNEPACKETLECRYWDEENLQWTTEGCVTKVYNGTDGSAFTGCECSHLSEFVSVTVPTDAFGDVDFGSIDVADGNLTHVSGERGGMWLTVHKEATRTPTITKEIHLAYADEAAAPHAWEVLNVTCPHGRAPPAGANGFENASARPDLTAISHCHWARATRLRGNLTEPMGIELSGSGLAEDRDAEAYTAHVTYALHADPQFELERIRCQASSVAHALAPHLLAQSLCRRVAHLRLAAARLRGGDASRSALRARPRAARPALRRHRLLRQRHARCERRARPLHLGSWARSQHLSNHQPSLTIQLPPPLSGAVLSLRSRGLPHLPPRLGRGTAGPLQLAATRRRAAQPAPTCLRRSRVQWRRAVRRGDYAAGAGPLGASAVPGRRAGARHRRRDSLLPGWAGCHARRRQVRLRGGDGAQARRGGAARGGRVGRRGATL